MAIRFDGVTSDVDTAIGRPWMKNVAGGTIMGWGTIALNGTQTMWGAFGATGTTRAKMSVNGAGQVSLRANALDSDATSSFNSTGAVTSGPWFHIAGVIYFATKTGIIYINGVVDTSGSFANMTAGNTSNTNCADSMMGTNETDVSNHWDGLLEDVRVYDRTLSDNEIMTIYSTMGKDGIVQNLQARWPMIELAPGTALVSLPDVSDNKFGGDPGGTVIYQSGIITPHIRAYRKRGRARF